ncbi:MAG TPA: ABC transporter ATP-binding protein, partial [Enterococcus sp.]|nr:ABC transporter ATP-binding protein [Enterococcus sp.]
KCNDYFMERKASGKTTILVTHDMGAVKKYCNRAVLIEDGLVKAYGDPEDVANQYSFDNAVSSASQEVMTEEDDETEKEEKKVEPYVDNLTVELLTPNKIRPTDKIEFEISYDVLKDVETHIVFSLTDIDRRIWMYNDNATNIPTTGTGHKSYRYTCSLGQVNNMKLRLEVTILGKSKEMYAFANSENSPLIVVNRDDIPLDDLSALDSATGIIQRNGKWDILSE